MTKLWQDVIFAVRLFVRNRTFAVAVTAILGLAMGVNTTLFSLIDVCLLSDLPVRDPQQLVYPVWSARFANQNIYTIRDFEAFRDDRSVTSGAISFSLRSLALETEGGPERVSVEYVSDNYFEMLGVQPALGRLFASGDDTGIEGANIAVLSHGCWIRRFGGDRSVIGRTVRLKARPVVIVGVTPEGFSGFEQGYAAEFHLLLSQLFDLPQQEAQAQTDNSVQVVARLKPGVSLKQAEAHLAGVFLRRFWEKQGYRSPEKQRAYLEFPPRFELREARQGIWPLSERYRQPLQILFSICGSMLLIAGANIAGLLLAQAEQRQPERAIRLALGATRTRLVRQRITETLLLSLAAAGVALLFTMWVGNMLLACFPQDYMPLAFDIRPNSRMLAVTVGLAVLASFACGTLAALQGGGRSLVPPLKGDSRVFGRTRPLGARQVLLTGQVALSVCLLVGAGLLLKSLYKLLVQDTGFARNHLLLVSFDPVLMGQTDFEAARRVYLELGRRAAALPGVSSAALGRYPLLGRTFAVAASPLTIDGKPQEEGPPESWATRNAVDPNYFATVGMELTKGRNFSDADHASAEKVAIVNEQFVRRYAGGRDPIGMHIGWSWNHTEDTRIVGVVRDAKYTGIREGPAAYWYIPYSQLPTDRWPRMTLHLRISTHAEPVVNGIRNELKTTGVRTAITNIQTIESAIRQSAGNERLVGALAAFLALFVAILAGLGIYSLVSQSVVRRTREIGVRIALGATRGRVERLLIGETSVLIVVGSMIGVALAIAWKSVLSSFLFGVSSVDPSVIAAAVLVVAATAAGAAFAPARRASHCDPVRALRCE